MMPPLLLCRFVQITAAVLLGGTALLRLLAEGAEIGREVAARWNRLAAGSWCVLLAANAFQLWLTVADMSGQPLARAFSGESLGSVLGGTRFGTVWLARCGLLGALLPIVLTTAAAARRNRGPGRMAAAVSNRAGVALCAALLASFVWSGHAIASANSAWLLPVDGLHVIAAGAWPGGLWPLMILLGRARRDPALLLPAAMVTRRFSRVSVAAVGVLALTGLLNGCGLVGTFSALASSGVYGAMLLCKAVLFAGMAGLGAVNRRLIGPEASADPAAAARRLRRNVAWECALAALVLLAAETLAMSAPPAQAE